MIVGFFIVLSILTHNLSATDNDDNPVIKIKNGLIRGRKWYTGTGKGFSAFLGIPYAEPPVGNLRFSAPVEKLNWDDTLNVTWDQNKCIQGYPAEGSEDCLYISVYTPNLKSNLSVMVWIYGGAFLFGDSSYLSQSPDNFLDEDIVFVQFNYRLGVFGFLSTEDVVCSGNWGLKDQVLALKWIQENIAYFGGNPESVTVFGESAGAASISYLMQTDQTKGLFKAAILESGTSLNLWALSRKARDTSFFIAVALGFIPTNSTELVTQLRSIEAHNLHEVATNIAGTIMMLNALSGLILAPVIEPDYDGALIVSYSHDLLSQGGFHKIPTIIGFNSNEAAVFGTIPHLLRLYMTSYNVQVENLSPVDLTDNDNHRLEAATKIKNYYFGNDSIAMNINRVVKFLSDDQFNRPITEVAKLQSQFAPVYFYMFSYEGFLGGVSNRYIEGVGHAEDIGYLFKTSQNVFEGDDLTRSRMIKLWTNFAKYNNPTPSEEVLLQNITWKIAGSDSENLKYLDIGINLEMKENPCKESIDFYESLYSEFGNPPYNTY